MWIEGISIDSFGAFRDLRVAGLGPTLNVLVGPNEAGKSTVLEFVRAVLFGFKTRTSRANTFEPRDGTPRKGRLTFRSDNCEGLHVERTEKQGTKEGALEVWDLDGSRLDPEAVPLFRRTMDRDAYERLLTLDLDRMRHLDRETLRGKIVAAALGSLEVNPVHVLGRLDGRLKALAKRSRRDSQCLLAMQSKVQELTRRLRTLQEKPARYTELREELVLLDGRRREISEETHTAEAEARRLSRVVKYEGDWKRLSAVDLELESLADAETFPADGLARWEQILLRRDEASEALTELKQNLDRLLTQRANLRPDHLVAACSEQINALHGEGKRLADHPRELERMRAQVAEALARLDEELTRLGTEWTRQRLFACDLSLVLEHRIRSFQEAWEARQQKIRDAEARVRESDETLERLEQRADAKKMELQRVIPLCRGFLTPRARNSLLEWKELQRRISSLEEKLEERNRTMRMLAANREDAERRLTDLDREPSSPISPLFFWSALFILAAAGSGMLAAAARSPDAASYAFFFLGLVALGFVTPLVMWKIRWERRRAERMREEKAAIEKRRDRMVQDAVQIEAQRRTLIRQIQELGQRSRNITDEVLGNSLVTFEDILEVERRSAVAEEPDQRRRLLEESLQEYETDLALEQSQRHREDRTLASQQDEFRRLRAEWEESLPDLGLDSDCEPGEALELFGRLHDLKADLRKVSEQEQTLRIREDEWNRFCRQVSDLGEELGLRDTSLSPLELVEQWVRRDRENREIFAEKKALDERVNDHQARFGALRKKIEDAEAHEADLMRAAAVDNEEAFRERALRHERYENLFRDRGILVETLLSGLRCPDEESLRSLGSQQDWDENKALLSGYETRLGILRQETEDLAARHGRLKQEIETLERDEETEQLLCEREEWVARLNQGLAEYVAVRMAQGLVEKTVKVYESEKQPRVLARSSELFSGITGETDRRILFPLGADHVVVEKGDGTRIYENHLSRGTLEQVYLSLRLAHVDVYHRSELPFPLLMDDVLVNFDPDRARRAAETLTDFSENVKIQVLFFTCHPNTAELFPTHVPRIKLGESQIHRPAS